jgi:subfamily B ATP-binding cassette protein MsbA
MRNAPGFLRAESASEALGITTIGLGVFLLSGKCVFGYLKRYLRSWLSRRVVIDTQKKVAEHLLTLEMGYFQSKHSGEVVSRMTNDMQLLSRSVSLFGIIITEPITLLGGVIAIFYTNWQLALISFVALPLGGVVVSHLSRKMRKAAKRAYEHLADATGIMIQFLGGIKTVKAFGQEEHELKRFNRMLSNLFNVGMKGARARARVRPIVELLAGTGALAVLFIGGRWCILGHIKPEELIAFYTLLGLMYQPAKQFSNANSELQEAIPAAQRVFEVFDAKPEIVDSENAVELQGIDEKVEFKNLSFSYDKDHDVLHDVNLTIPKGQVVALVGPSGAGKSTLADLLARFYDPQQGEILIDNKNIKDVTMASLMRNIAIVSQNSFLFHDTIKANIAYANLDATDEEIFEAAKAASIHEEILSLADGYDTIAGDRGDNLSGGQKQRVCIARAILKNAPILILDEATSALDTENERLVQEALQKLMQNRTSVVIAHRLSTIRHADKAVVMEAGRIVAEGTHDELITKGGVYAQLWAMQCGE